MTGSSKRNASLVIWRISDGRAGHDSQSRGLVEALNRRHPCDVYELSAMPTFSALLCMLSRRYPPGKQLPAPGLIIGAGHGTHLNLLAARRARGGQTVVIMKPSLPTSWFDWCLIPAHDETRISDNIIVTEGALNTMQASASLDKSKGLILIGGPSRHYLWDQQQLLNQLQIILDRREISWRITDSRRTPPATRQALHQLAANGVDYHSYLESDPGWLIAQLKQSATVWVTEDSISMIYEAITAGAAVGLLNAPRKGSGRVIYAVNRLIQNRMVTPFDQWQAGEMPAPVTPPLDEANRCAGLLLDRLGLSSITE